MGPRTPFRTCFRTPRPPRRKSQSQANHAPQSPAARRLLPLFRLHPPKLVRARNLRLTMYVELHARSAFSFLEGASVPEELAGLCAERGMGAMALLDRDGVYGSPRFHLAAEKTFHSGAHRRRSHLRGGLALSAARRIARGLPESLPPDHAHEIAREKRRRPRLARRSRRKLHRPHLPHRRRRRPARARSRARRNRSGRQCVGQLCELFGRDNVYVELQRHFCREEEARNQAALEIARKLHSAAARHQWRLLCAAAAARNSRRLHLHPPPPHSGNRRKASRPQFRAPSEISRGDGALFSRSSRSHRQHRSFFPRA